MRSFASRISVFVLASAGAFAQSIAAPPAVTRTTGMIGVAEGQIARLNVLNPGVLPPAMGAACSAALAFLDPNGKVLKSTTVNVAPGRAASPFDLSGDVDLSLALDMREEIRATITIPAIVPVSTTASSTSSSAAPNIPVASCKLIATLEIFDSITRRTQAVLGGTHSVPVGPVATPAPSN